MRSARLFLMAGSVGLLLLFQGCASLRSVSMTRVPQNRSHPIEAEGFSWGIFGIYFTNSFVDDAVDQLKQKCPDGKISGVYTKYSGRFYLLWTTRTVDVTAYCEPNAPRLGALER